MSCNEKIAVEVFRVEEIPLGTKGRFHLVIDNMPDGGDLLFPALIVRGRRPGKTLSWSRVEPMETNMKGWWPSRMSSRV